jgi:hypothetical protein
MSKEPSVPPYTLQSPPHYGATYQNQPDTQSFTERQAIANGNGKGHGSGKGNGNGNGARPSVPGGSLTELLGQFWTRYRPLKSVDGTDDSPAAQTGDDDNASGVVYAITKKTDFWFDREVFVIERDAKREAADWAEHGLPRHDLERVDPLEVELVLGNRCVELFRQWVGRVRTRMRDAINEEAEFIASQTSALEASIDRLGTLRDTSKRSEEEIGYLMKKEHEEHPPLGFEPIVTNPLFFPTLAVLLVAVEFFANFPLFRLLLPLHSALAAAAKEAVLNVGDQWYAGLALWWKMTAWHVEAAVVSLAVVVVLVVFGKSVGQSVRLLAAMRTKDHPLAAGSLASARRQAWTVVIACVLGSGMVITALFWARSQIVVAAQDRVATTARNLDSLRVAQSNLPRGAIAQMSSLTQSIRDQERTLEVHRDDFGYAQTVQTNNMAILLLNIGLVLAAGLVGFLSAKFKLTNQFGADPRIAELREKQARIDADLRTELANGYQSMTAANAGIGRVQHLIRSSPLEQWPAKAKRLAGVIPLFRADNARLRGLDSASILAFRQPPPLDLPTFEAEKGFEEPADFAALKDRYSHARLQFTRLAGAAQ